MRVAIRSAGVTITAIVAAVFLTVTTTMTSARAATALMVGGIAAGSLPDLVMSNVLGGRFSGTAPDGTNWVRDDVVWPAQARPYTALNHLTMGESIAWGIHTLSQMVKALRETKPNEQITIVGMSAGALVVDDYLRELTSATAPDPSKLNIVIVADSSRQDVINKSQYNPIYNYTYQPPPQIKYTTTVVTGEYDGAADFPDRPWNVLAVVNATVGALFVHVPVMFADLNQVPTENITTTYNSVGGKTVHYLVPTARLPLVQMLPLLAPWESVLKQWVDAGYSRNDAPAATSLAAAGLAAADIQTEGETTTESSTHAIDSTQAVDTNRGSLTEPVETSTKEGENSARTAEATQRRSPQETTEARNQPDEGLGTNTEERSNKVTDLTDGNKVTPTTYAGEEQSSGKLRQEDANQQLPSGDPSTSSTSTTEDNDPSTTKDNPSTTKDNDPSTTKGDPSSSGTVEGNTE